jgi:hypothetical protein
MLEITITHPLEREYEAWITHGIESYFDELNVDAAVWAISPMNEKTWPSDIGVGYPAKLVGLQIKRPTIANFPLHGSAPTFDRIKWYLASPKGQSALLSAIDDIFYCFPTFLNRTHRHQALSHCVFWRPDPGTPPPSRVWYENARAASAPSVSKEMRWGRFVERILACNIGFPAFNPDLVTQFFARMREIVRESQLEIALDAQEEPTSSFTTLFVAIRL